MRNGAAMQFPQWRQRVAGSLAGHLADMPPWVRVFGEELPLDLAPRLVQLLSEAQFARARAASPEEQWVEIVPAKGVRLNFLTGDVEVNGKPDGNNGKAEKSVIYNPPPAAQQPPRGAPTSEVYLCAHGCGYLGTFSVVCDHERVCKAGMQGGVVPDALGKGGGKPDAPADEAWYTCEFDCGFVGYYQAVCDHEKDCAKRNQPNGAGGFGGGKGGFPQSTMYVCAFSGCNYLDSYEKVELHEATCKLNPANQKPEPVAPAAAAPAAAIEPDPAPAAEAAAAFVPSGVEPFHAVVVHDFTKDIFPSQNEEILFFKAGDKVTVVDVDDQGHWWFGSVDGNSSRQGWFPTEYVRKID